VNAGLPEIETVLTVSTRGEKPLKRLSPGAALSTRLKPGVNETEKMESVVMKLAL
jgi:hypothetical protein